MSNARASEVEEEVGVDAKKVSKVVGRRGSGKGIKLMPLHQPVFCPVSSGSVVVVSLLLLPSFFPGPNLGNPFKLQTDAPS